MRRSLRLRLIVRVAVALSVVLSAAVQAEQATVLRGKVVASGQPAAIVDSDLRAFRWESVTVSAHAEPSLKLQFLTEGERGNTRQMLHDVRRERAHVAELSLHDLLQVVPEIGVVLAPYVFESDAEAQFVVDNYLFNTLGDLLAAQNLLLLHWLDLGWQGVYSTRPLELPDTGARVIIGGRDYPVNAEFFAAAGARFFPVSAYQQSLSARFTPNGTLCRLLTTCFSVDAEFAKTQNAHLLLTSHSYDVGVLIANKNWFDEATEVQTQALRRVLNSGIPVARGAPSGLRHTAIAELSKRQVQVAALSWRQTHVLREIGQKSHPGLIEQIGGSSVEVWEAIQAGKRAFAAMHPAAEVGAAR